MATLLLSAAGAALGGAVGGSFAGMSSLVLGKAIGATLGSVIDQRLLGAGSQPVETGRVERFQVMGSSEGAALARVFGRTRVAGQIIWSSRFLEHVNEEEVGGKGGGGGGGTVREFSYTVSLAVALCEGEVLRVGRIWADGQALDQSGLNWRLHTGGEDQLPDPLIDPEEVASAILRAAEQPTREIKVGAMAKVNTLVSKLLPRLADKLSAKRATQQQREEPPRDPQGTLYKAGECGRVRGSHAATTSGHVVS